ncbi:MAG: Transcriptional regulator, ArsR family, partial [uncultured Sphingosinicella sp.]
WTDSQPFPIPPAGKWSNCSVRVSEARARSGSNSRSAPPQCPSISRPCARRASSVSGWTGSGASTASIPTASPRWKPGSRRCAASGAAASTPSNANSRRRTRN